VVPDQRAGMSDSFDNVAASTERLVGIRQVDSFGLAPQATLWLMGCPSEAPPWMIPHWVCEHG